VCTWSQNCFSEVRVSRQAVRRRSNRTWTGRRDSDEATSDDVKFDRRRRSRPEHPLWQPTKGGY
jgi:hypothetical protein